MSALRSLSEQVMLQTQILTPDSSGGQMRVWQDMALVWAEVRPASATEGTRLGGTTTRRFIKVFIRDRPDIVLPLRVIWDAKALRVLALRNRPMGRLEIECEEILQ
ncbi:MAG: head-tail adaptor protein [Robiginitomaculum sp.]|nr:head-tail adaptor protein [Robiginitomaculum sp.]